VKTALKTIPWDTAEHLKTEEDRLMYLLACIEEAPADPAFFKHALGTIARSRNMSALARETGLTREGLYKAFSEIGNPSFTTMWKVLNALGYRLRVEAIPQEVVRKAPAKRAIRPQERIAAKRAPRAATKSATGKAGKKTTKR
jgi:probable addiction module antidote protein